MILKLRFDKYGNIEFKSRTLKDVYRIFNNLKFDYPLRLLDKETINDLNIYTHFYNDGIYFTDQTIESENKAIKIFEFKNLDGGLYRITVTFNFKKKLIFVTAEAVNYYTHKNIKISVNEFLGALKEFQYQLYNLKSMFYNFYDSMEKFVTTGKKRSFNPMLETTGKLQHLFSMSEYVNCLDIQIVEE